MRTAIRNEAVRIGMFVLIDEEYRTFGGHQAAYDLPICEELARRGIAYCLLADSALKPGGTEPEQVVPMFHTRAALRFQSRYLPQPAGRIVATAVGNLVTLWDLVRAATPRITGGDIIVLTRPLSRTRIAYAIWLGYLFLLSRRVTIIHVVHNEPEPLFAFQMLLLCRLARPHRLELVAHSTAVASLVQRRLGIVPTVVALPFKAARLASRLPVANEPVRFAFLGLGHRTKGLDLVVRAIEQSTDLLLTRRVEFALQCYLPFADPRTDGLHRETRRLKERFIGVEILDRELSPSEYLHELEVAHIILVPHRLEAYRLALSGVFADAMGAGRPVVVADGSYMGELIHESGAGLTFESGNAASLAQAIRLASASVEVLMQRAQLVSAQWEVDQGPNAFVSGLLRLLSIPKAARRSP